MPANPTAPRPLLAARAGRASSRPAVPGPHPAAESLPYWRALLEARWQARLRQVTELSLAFHDAAEAAHAGRTGSGTVAGQAQVRLRELMRRAVIARRALADVDAALTRLEAGRFGRCEQCAAAIPAATLAHTPETRYCSGCDFTARH